MMKRVLLACAVVLSVLPVQAMAAGAPEVWSCEFKGTWTEGASKSKGPFTWSVTWTETGKGWKMTGSSTDELGKSSTTGTCDDATCAIAQTYTSGDLRGETYYWAGSYVDADGKSDDTLVETFKGTWGESANDRKSGGTWQAKATCKAK